MSKKHKGGPAPIPPGNLSRLARTIRNDTAPAQSHGAPSSETILNAGSATMRLRANTRRATRRQQGRIMNTRIVVGVPA